jgi:hypothetical protein
MSQEKSPRGSTSRWQEMKKDMLWEVYSTMELLAEGEDIDATDTQKEALLAIYAEFPKWDMFYDYHKRLATPTIVGVIAKANSQKNVTLPPDIKSVHNAVETLQRYIRYEGRLPNRYHLILTNLRLELETKCPLEVEIHDMNYIKYSDCCHCGEPAPPGGNTLTFRKSAGWKYPICDKCLAEDSPVDMERLAELYYKYALTIEYAMDKIY